MTETLGSAWNFNRCAVSRKSASSNGDVVKIYTKTGDDGTTGLLYGGRVRKDDPAPAAYGEVDEAQAVIGVARAHANHLAQSDEALRADYGELNTVLLQLESDMWVLMAELATAQENRHKLQPGASLVTADMVDKLETLIDDYAARYVPSKDFVVPGGTIVSAHLDHARTVTRRAERQGVRVHVEGGLAVPYLNRLSDLLFTLARWTDAATVTAKSLR